MDKASVARTKRFLFRPGLNIIIQCCKRNYNLQSEFINLKPRTKQKAFRPGYVTEFSFSLGVNSRLALHMAKLHLACSFSLPWNDKDKIMPERVNNRKLAFNDNQLKI